MIPEDEGKDLKKWRGMMRITNDNGLNFQNYWENWFGNKHEGSIPFTRFILKCNVSNGNKEQTIQISFAEFAFHFLKICVAVFRNRSRAAALVNTRALHLVNGNDSVIWVDCLIGAISAIVSNHTVAKMMSLNYN